MIGALGQAFDAYTRWLMRWRWFRWLTGRAEALDAQGRNRGYW